MAASRSSLEHRTTQTDAGMAVLQAAFEEGYINDSDPSVLRFLIASAQEVSASQLRDDLLSMLVAGHETTASVLTWTLHLLAQHPAKLAKVRPPPTNSDLCREFREFRLDAHLSTFPARHSVLSHMHKEQQLQGRRGTSLRSQVPGVSESDQVCLWVRKGASSSGQAGGGWHLSLPVAECHALELTQSHCGP